MEVDVVEPWTCSLTAEHAGCTCSHISTIPVIPGLQSWHSRSEASKAFVRNGSDTSNRHIRHIYNSSDSSDTSDTIQKCRSRQFRHILDTSNYPALWQLGLGKKAPCALLCGKFAGMKPGQPWLGDSMNEAASVQ